MNRKLKKLMETNNCIEVKKSKFNGMTLRNQ